MVRSWRPLALGLLVLCFGGVGHALDQPISATKVQLRRSSSGKQRLTFTTRDAKVPFGSSGSSDDPATGTGLTIEIFSQAEGARPGMTAPPGIGKPGWKETPTKYSYRNTKAVAGPQAVKTVSLRQGRSLSVTSVDTSLALTGPQQRIAVRITTGALRSCAVFGPGTIKKDVTGNFLGTKAPVPALPDCSDASLTGGGSATTSTVTTVTTVPSTSSTSSTLPPGAALLDVTTVLGAGGCGHTADGAGTQIAAIGCGGLDIGGGSSTVPEGRIPDGVTIRYGVTGCAGSVCNLTATSGTGGGVDCSDAGCNFGPPLPIPNGSLSTCVVNQFGSPSSGTVNKATGAVSLAVPLASEIFLTSNGTQPCPRCSAIGSAGNPGFGTCDRGARQGLGCSTTNSQGLSSDCPPGGTDRSQDLGAIAIALSPLTTAGASRTSPDGVFCAQQTSNQGCFHSADCRGIFVDGLAAGALADNTPQPMSLASTFCIPKVSSGLVNGAASLPGPGAASLPGTVTLITGAGPGSTTSTTTATSTTSVTSTTGSTTTVSTSSTSTSTTSSTLLPALLPLTVEFATTAGSGSCGSARDGSGTVVESLACGDLALGSGSGIIPPSALPAGTVVHFKLGGCSVLPLLTCSLEATPTPGAGFDCSATGCHFGPPVPVPNGGLSACAVSTFNAPVSGTVNLLTGATTASIGLDLHVFLTGDDVQPCPRCSATGAPGAIGTGTCDRGARAGMTCTTTNPDGLSEDCLPGGSDGSTDVGTIAAMLSPVTTGTVSLANPSGVLCPGQDLGCFGHATCRSVTETGTSPGVAITSALSPQPATLVSTFCIPGTGNLLLDGPAGLPGPAAISLPGTVRSQM